MTRGGDHVSSIDPGYSKKGAAGWGHFDFAELTHAGLVRRDEAWSTGRMGLELGTRIVSTITSSVDVVVVERMQSYSHSAQKGDQNDLVKLAEVGAAAAGVIAGVRLLDDGTQLEIAHVTPHEWKGNVDPDIMIKRIQALLKPHELEVAIAAFERDANRAKSLWHNGWDAIGIGLVRLGRMKRYRCA